MRKHVVLPTARNVRTYRRLTAFGLAVAFLALVLAGVTFGMDRAGGSGRSPLSMIVLGLGFIATVVAWRSTADRLQQQIDQLASYGRRYAADRVATDAMQRGYVAGWQVVVAQWRDENGVTREALSEGFDYDPLALLDAPRVQVVADAFHPELCIVAGDTLPPRAWHDLDAARRAQVERRTPTPLGLRSIPVWVPMTLVLLALGVLAWMAA
jgi:F0F1-type ATP synthase assembly protein I